MNSLTKENIKHHCRTCLVMMNNTEGCFVAEESKDIWINIAENYNLQILIDKYISEERYTSGVDKFPQQMCLSCFNKIQQVDKFLTEAKFSAEKLYNIINAEDVLLENENMYKSLIEVTETMLLETAILQQNEITKCDDPFSVSLKENSAKGEPWSSTECNESSDTDWEASSISSISGDNIEKKTKKTLKNNLSDGQPVTKRRKGRFKLEKEPNEEIKAKRLKKGTRKNFRCTQCKSSFVHKYTLDAHIRKVHEGSKHPFHCDKCDKTYAFINGLKRHIQEVHEHDERSHTCDFPNCGRTYTSIVAMQLHKRFTHSPEAENKKYVCEQCGAAYNNSNSLRSHRHAKHPTEAEMAEKASKAKGKKQYECDICKKKYLNCYTLKYHKMQMHSTQMKFECEICGVKKALKHALESHMLVHSTNKLPCEYCGREFTRKFELESHVRTIHLKIKPFECKYCQACFTLKKTLKRHEFIHTGETPYVCDICGQGYRHSTCLKRHKKNHEKFKNSVNLNEAAQIQNATEANAMVGV